MKCSVVIIGIFLSAGMAAIGKADDLRSELFSGKRSPAAGAFVSNQASPRLGGDIELEGGRKATRGGAMLRSLLVPGWGESYLGYHRTARTFFWADVALWTTVIGLEVYSRWKEDQFLSFGATHSGAQMSGKTDRFYADIGDYLNTEAYNEAKLRQRAFDDLYTDPSYFWAWDTDANRQEYDHIRVQSGSAHNKIFFFIGAAALNRLISAIDTGKKATDMLREQQGMRMGLHFEPDRTQGSNGVRLVLGAQF
jgi:hypothetical protein